MNKNVSTRIRITIRDKYDNFFKVGDPVSYAVGSDIYAGTVIKVTSKRVDIRDNRVIPSPGAKNIGHQDWIITDALWGEVKTFTYKPSLRFFSSKKGRSSILFPGHKFHYDWAF